MFVPGVIIFVRNTCNSVS